VTTDWWAEDTEGVLPQCVATERASKSSQHNEQRTLQRLLPILYIVSSYLRSNYIGMTSGF
jgi:hypothetical protein